MKNFSWCCLAPWLAACFWIINVSVIAHNFICRQWMWIATHGHRNFQNCPFSRRWSYCPAWSLYFVFIQFSMEFWPYLKKKKISDCLDCRKENIRRHMIVVIAHNRKQVMLGIFHNCELWQISKSLSLRGNRTLIWSPGTIGIRKEKKKN